MSKLYRQYLDLKEQDSQQIYLFRSGIFYIFLGEDANMVSPKLGLKLTKFTDDTWKCGFPVNSLEKYQHRMQLLELNYQFVNDEKKVEETEQFTEEQNEYLLYLKNLDINEMRPIDAMMILKRFQEMFKNE